jgi:hypothetical protein
MHSGNLKLIRQSSWKVRVADFVCRQIGLLAHVEGMPIGDSAQYLRLSKLDTEASNA